MVFNHTPIGTNQTKGNDIGRCIFCSSSGVKECRTELRKGCEIMLQTGKHCKPPH